MRASIAYASFLFFLCVPTDADGLFRSTSSPPSITMSPSSESASMTATLAPSPMGRSLRRGNDTACKWSGRHGMIFSCRSRGPWR